MCLAPTHGRPICGRCGSAIVTGITDLKTLGVQEPVVDPARTDRHLAELIAKRRSGAPSYRPGPSSLASLSLFVKIGDDEIPVGRRIDEQDDREIVLATPVMPTQIQRPRATPHRVDEESRPSMPAVTPVSRYRVASPPPQSIGKLVVLAALVALLVGGAGVATALLVKQHNLGKAQASMAEAEPSSAAPTADKSEVPAQESVVEPPAVVVVEAETPAIQSAPATCEWDEAQGVRRGQTVRISLSGQHGFDRVVGKARSSKGWINIIDASGRNQRYNLKRPRQLRVWRDVSGAREVVAVKHDPSRDGDTLVLVLSNGSIETHTTSESLSALLVPTNGGCALSFETVAGGGI